MAAVVIYLSIVGPVDALNLQHHQDSPIEYLTHGNIQVPYYTALIDYRTFQLYYTGPGSLVEVMLSTMPVPVGCREALEITFNLTTVPRGNLFNTSQSRVLSAQHRGCFSRERAKFHPTISSIALSNARYGYC